jgi:hypothetical protein
VDGSLVQAGAVYGDVYIGSSAHDAAVFVPRQLLPPPVPFASRQRELAVLHDSLYEPDPSAPTVVVLRGPSGIGKTALALRWLSEVVDRFPHGQLYADLALSTGEPVAPEDILGFFLRALGVVPQRVPPGFAERAALYRSVTAGRTIVVLLDNALSAAQARVLLPAASGSLAVVTTRRPLLGLLAVGARAVPVGPLDRSGALELLAHGIGAQRMHAEGDAAARLAELCGGLPIALCVAAARAATRPRRPLARMVEELSDERDRLDVLSTEGDLSVRSIFDIAYAGLPADLQGVYRTLGLHPGRSFTAQAIAAAVGADVRTARRALDDLVDASLAEELDLDRYRLHDLVRLHAQHKALESGQDHTAAVLRTLEWYLFAAQAAGRTVMPARRVLGYDFLSDASDFAVPTGINEHVAALDWLEFNRPNLATAVQDAAKHEWPELAYRIADALQPVFLLHGHPRMAVEVGEVALRAAEAWGDPAAENSMRKRLARTYLQLGHLDHAERHATTLMHRARTRRDRRAEASALKTIALAHVSAGRLAEAASLFQETLALLRVLGKRRGEGLLLIELGTTLTRIGDVEGAIGQLTRAKETLDSLDPPDPYNAARAAAALGWAYLAAARHQEAGEVLEVATAVLADQRANEERANAHDALAELARRVGDEEGASRHSETAAALRRAAMNPLDDNSG